MGMLHPMYNHLGRSSKRPGTTKALEKARSQHETWLKRRGLPSTLRKRIILKGAHPLPNANQFNS